MSTHTDTALVRLSRGLLASMYAIHEADGPKARQVATARFGGMCDAAHRLGIGMTPDHVHLTTQDVFATGGARPAGGAFPGHRKAFDAAQAERLADLLRDI